MTTGVHRDQVHPFNTGVPCWSFASSHLQASVRKICDFVLCIWVIFPTWCVGFGGIILGSIFMIAVGFIPISSIAWVPASAYILFVAMRLIGTITTESDIVSPREVPRISGIEDQAPIAAEEPRPHVQIPRAEWITPEEQLYQLALSMASMQLDEKMRTAPNLIPPTSARERIANIVTECAAGSILRLSGLSYTERAANLAELATGALVEPRPLPSILTDWYTALKRLKILPEKIPPLPARIHEILDSECPIYRGQRKPDGTSYKIKDTHFLSLIPEEFGTLLSFERNVVKPYAEEKYPENVKPPQFSFSWTPQFDIMSDPFAPTHWALISRDVLPESLGTPYSTHEAQVAALSRQALAVYEKPTIQQIFAAIVTHKVATGESLYSDHNQPTARYRSLTTVKEKHRGCDRAVGVRLWESSLAIHHLNGIGAHHWNPVSPWTVGVAALRKL